MLPLMVTNVLGGLAINRPLPQGFTAVEYRFAFGHGDLALDQILLEVKPQWNQGKALFLRLADELVDFPAVQEQPAVAQRILIHVAPGRICADVAINEPRLAIAHQRVAIFDRRPALADGLHFRPGQLNSGFKLLEEVIIVRCLPVHRQVFLLLVFGLGRHKQEGRRKPSF